MFEVARCALFLRILRAACAREHGTTLVGWNSPFWNLHCQAVIVSQSPANGLDCRDSSPSLAVCAAPAMYTMHPTIEQRLKSNQLQAVDLLHRTKSSYQVSSHKYHLSLCSPQIHHPAPARHALSLQRIPSIARNEPRKETFIPSSHIPTTTDVALDRAFEVLYHALGEVSGACHVRTRTARTLTPGISPRRAHPHILA